MFENIFKNLGKKAVEAVSPDLQTLIKNELTKFRNEVNKDNITKLKAEIKKDKDKADRLTKLGFDNVEIVIEVAIKQVVINDLELKFNAYNYFTKKYPHEFVTEDIVNNICHNTGFGVKHVCNYKGDVPIENIEDLENIKLLKKEMSWQSDRLYIDIWYPYNTSHIYCSYKDRIEIKKEIRILK